MDRRLLVRQGPQHAHLPGPLHYCTALYCTTALRCTALQPPHQAALPAHVPDDAEDDPVDGGVLACSLYSRKGLPSSTAYRSDRGSTGPASAPAWGPLCSGQVTNRIFILIQIRFMKGVFLKVPRLPLVSISSSSGWPGGPPAPPPAPPPAAVSGQETNTIFSLGQIRFSVWSK